MILRTQYLERIRPFYDSELIKVITGVRRCGKSVLLRQIADEIRAEHFDSTEPDTLVFVDFDDYANRELTDPDKLYRFIKPKLSDERKTYLLFDEIQNVRDFELVVNSFNTTDNVSIFLTGSNALGWSHGVVPCDAVQLPRVLLFQRRSTSFGDFRRTFG